ncbi:lysophosphatidic acid receptor 2-like [Watersipora subatra]|uniref:lysophosphatidic acid receptor 2-like n=1 Tax=Watersipora subatra TaxID=2589382 RepID=UPI00355AD1D0
MSSTQKLNASTAAEIHEKTGLDGEIIILYFGLVVNAVGLLLNILSVTCIARVKKNDTTRKQHTYFLLNILVCDILITCSGVVFVSLKLFQLNNIGDDEEVLDPALHQLRENFYCAQSVALRFFDVGTTANLVGLLLMSLDHFIVVRFSLQHRLLMRSRVVFSLLSVGWALSAVLGLLKCILIASKKTKLADGLRPYNINITGYCSLEAYYYVQRPGTGEYFIPVGQKQDSNIRFGVAVVLITLTFTSMFFIHSYIAYTVVRVSKEQQKRLKHSSLKSSLIDMRMRKSQFKGVCTTVMFLGTFAALWLPTNIMYIMKMRGSKTLSQLGNSEQAESILLVIASMTGILDVAIYFLRSRELTAVLEVKSKCLKANADVSKSSSNTMSTKDTTTV